MDNLPQHTSGVFLLRPMVGFYSGVDILFKISENCWPDVQYDSAQSSEVVLPGYNEFWYRQAQPRWAARIPILLPPINNDCISLVGGIEITRTAHILKILVKHRL